jgi:ElaA protein
MNLSDHILWQVLEFRELALQQLHDLLRLRVDVFVVEQKCPYPEIDGQDAEALHVLGYKGEELVAYARILPPHEDGLPHIGRVVIASSARGTGLGRAVMEHAIKAVEAYHGSRSNAVAAQAHLQRFYESLGYVRTSKEEYMWDDIPHVDMVLNAPG